MSAATCRPMPREGDLLALVAWLRDVLARHCQDTIHAHLWDALQSRQGDVVSVRPWYTKSGRTEEFRLTTAVSQHYTAREIVDLIVDEIAQ